jgi:hypothetical protein
MSSGLGASYVKGPLTLDISCVPIATRVLFRARLACNLSCREMKDWYLLSSNLIPRRMAAAAYGRTAAVYPHQSKILQWERTSGLMVRVSIFSG